jgi:hypothetical protein
MNLPSSKLSWHESFILGGRAPALLLELCFLEGQTPLRLAKIGNKQHIKHCLLIKCVKFLSIIIL